MSKIGLMLLFVCICGNENTEAIYSIACVMLALKMKLLHYWTRTDIKQELGECIPPPIWKFLAPPNRKSMGQSRSLMIFLCPDYEVNEGENQKGSKLHRSPFYWIFSE